MKADSITPKKDNLAYWPIRLSVFIAPKLKLEAAWMQFRYIIYIFDIKNKSPPRGRLSFLFWGVDGTRTRDEGFADPCLTNLATTPWNKRAGEEIRTLDLLLGKETFYHWTTPAKFGLTLLAESAERQNRTDDTAIFSRVLYQLSYLGQYLVVKRQDFTSRLGDCQAEVVMKIKSKPGLSKRYATGIMPSAFPQGMVSGRGSARLERTVRVREVGGSNPPAPTETPHHRPTCGRWNFFHHSISYVWKSYWTTQSSIWTTSPPG